MTLPGFVGADYSVCYRCSHGGEVGTHAAADYCLKESDTQEGVRRHSKFIYIGCQEFSWNGMPVHKDVLEHTKSVLPKSRLLNIESATLSGLLEFWELVEENSWGSNFDRDKFDRDHPNFTETGR